MAALVRCRKARPSPSNPAHCPGRASYLTPVRGGCPAARRVLVLSRDEALWHAETGFLLAGQAGVAGDQRLACHRTWPARDAGAAPAYLSPARPRRKPGQLATGAPAWPLRRRTRAVSPPTAPRRGGMPGEGWPSARGGRQPGAARLLRFRWSRRSAIPASPQPGISPGCEAQLTG